MTNSGRLDDLNAEITRHLAPAAPVRVVDAGISSGLLTSEWVRHLQAAGHDCQVTAFDRTLSAKLLVAGPIELLAETSGHVLLIHTGSRSISRPVHRVAGLRNAVSRFVFGAAGVLMRLGGLFGLLRDVRLVSPRVLASDNIALLEKDIFAPHPPWSGAFDVVRVANLLNKAYFDDGQLQLGLANVASWLKDGGLLVIVRTGSDGANNATIFRREGPKLACVSRLGAGSEVEALVPQMLSQRPG